MSTTRTATAAGSHKWEFKARFRRRAFGWRSQPAIQRIKQAASEIKKIARRDPVLAAEGAVLFLERVSPAIENVDSSSGAIGTAVNRAIDALVPIIAEAQADSTVRDAWLERLWEAHADDQIPYIERLADHWGELCGSNEVASLWADRLLGVTRMALSPDKNLRGYFHGTTACLSALYRAERYDEAVVALKSLPAGAREDTDVLVLLAVALTNRGDADEAERVCARILAADEFHAGAYYLQALCREHMGERQAAIRAGEIAAYLDPTFAMPHLHLGLVHRRTGDAEQARRALKRARALLPQEDVGRILLFGGGFSRDALIRLCDVELAAQEEHP